MDTRCEHGVPLGKDNPNLPCSRCELDGASPEDDDAGTVDPTDTADRDAVVTLRSGR
jgi:hypothetical protein